MRWRRIFVAIGILALGAGYFIHRGATHAGHGASASDPAGQDAVTPTERTAPNVEEAPRIARTRSTNRIASSSPAPLPPPGTPLKAAMAELSARADAGDSEAASRLARDLNKCTYVARMKQLLPQIVPFALDEDDKKLTAKELSQREKSLGLYQRELDRIHDNEALCAGLDRADFDALTPALLRAAQLGDARATDCYLSSGLTGMQGLLDHPEWLADFKRNAMPLAHTAIERGDWVAVGILEHAYGGFFSDFMSQITGPDLAQRYRYLSLQRLGARGDFIAKLDRQIAAIVPSLTPAQVSDGDSWAQDTYTRYFNGSSSNELSNGTNVCWSDEN